MTSNLIPAVTLKEENGFINYLEWKRAWETYLPSYGTAGKEILEDREIRALDIKPMIAATITEEQLVNNVVERVTRNMTNEDRKAIPAKLTAWETAEEKYRKTRGQLFVGLLSTIESSLRTYVENQPEYDDILIQNNIRSLWKLVRKVIANKGGSQTDLIMKWRNLTQGSKSLSEHVNQFEKLFANIDTTVQTISQRQKSEQLVKSVDMEYFNPIIARYIIMIEKPIPEGTPDPFPTYNDVKDELFRYDEVMKKARAQSATSTKLSSNETAFYTSNYQPICYNCLQPGHYKRQCTNPPKCSFCGNRHPTSRHNSNIGGNQQSDGRYMKDHRDSNKDNADSSKKFKLVKLVNKPTSSSSKDKSSENNVGSKKVFKKPFDIKIPDKKPKQYKKVYYYQEIEEEDIDDSDDDSIEIEEEILVDE